MSSACLICSSKSQSTLFRMPGLTPTCFAAICNDCGFVFLSPAWSKERYGDYYRREYDLEFRAELSSDEVFANKLRNGREVLARIKPFIEAPRSILDIGSGPGAQLRAAAEAFPHVCRLEAIEMSEQCRKALEEQEFRIISADIYENWHLEKSGNYELVIMRHVLEHCLDPDQVLAKVRTILSPGGLFYLAVPDMEDPKGSLKYSWFRVAHVWYFHMNALLAIAVRNGFKVLHAGKKNSELFLILRRSELAEPAPNLIRQNEAMKLKAYIRRKARLESVKVQGRWFKAALKRLLSLLSPSV